MQLVVSYRSDVIVEKVNGGDVPSLSDIFDKINSVQRYNISKCGNVAEVETSETSIDEFSEQLGTLVVAQLNVPVSPL